VLLGYAEQVERVEARRHSARGPLVRPVKQEQPAPFDSPPLGEAVDIGGEAILSFNVVVVAGSGSRRAVSGGAAVGDVRPWPVARAGGPSISRVSIISANIVCGVASALRMAVAAATSGRGSDIVEVERARRWRTPALDLSPLIGGEGGAPWGNELGADLVLH
jgi:hypothetical protein